MPASEPLVTGERIAKVSVVTLLVIGFAELLVGRLTLSLGLTADGVTSMLDALISLIVWLGLHFSRRRPDVRFHFGYHKVETLSSLIVSISMIGIAVYIIFVSYMTFLNPKPIAYPFVALVTLLSAGIVSMYRISDAYSGKEISLALSSDRCEQFHQRCDCFLRHIWECAGGFSWAS